MGLISETTIVKWHPSNKKYYESKGYVFTKWKDELEVKVEDLPKGSHSEVKVKCDACGELLDIPWFTYVDNVKENGDYFCRICAVKLFSSKKRIELMLNNNSTSFAQCGINKYGEDFLEKYWDYENNLGINPWEICSSSSITVFIKCQNREYHKSYPISCDSFTRKGKNIRCPYCHGRKIHPKDSLGQYIIDIFGEEFLEKIWSKKNLKSPFEYIPYGHQEVWWKCLNGHEDYLRRIDNSNTYNFRCPECQYSQGEEKIKEILKLKEVPHDSQYKFDDLIGLGGGLLKFDVPIFWDKEKTQLRMLIEFDGRQHFEWVKGFYTKEDFKKLQYHDKLKNDYCKENKIKLIRIPYWDFDNIKDILERKLNEVS